MADMGIPEIEREDAQELIAAIAQREESMQGDPYEAGGIPMSAAGEECMRSVWYSLRWVTPAQAHEARALRIFETRDIYRDRMMQSLMAACAEYWTAPPSKGKFAVSVAGGWVTGKIDLVVRGVPGKPPGEVFCVVMEPHSEKSFKRVVKSTLKSAHPRHYGQIQIGMQTLGLMRGIYAAVNKSTDELHIEVIKRDIEYTNVRLGSIENTVRSNFAPPRISENPDFFMCRFCDHRATCHERAMPERRTCRNCIHSTPAKNGAESEFDCDRHEMSVPLRDQHAGCDNHLFMPELIPGEQVDASEVDEYVSYAMDDGSNWVDRGQELGK